MYSVNLYGSHPEEDRDECWDGRVFNTKADALAMFNDQESLIKEFGRRTILDTAFIEIDGDDINEIRKNPCHAPSRDDEWRREQAMQAGMAFGCDGYNDVMGY